MKIVHCSPRVCLRDEQRTFRAVVPNNSPRNLCADLFLSDGRSKTVCFARRRRFAVSCSLSELSASGRCRVARRDVEGPPTAGPSEVAAQYGRRAAPLVLQTQVSGGKTRIRKSAVPAAGVHTTHGHHGDATSDLGKGQTDRKSQNLSRNESLRRGEMLIGLKRIRFPVANFNRVP